MHESRLAHDLERRATVVVLQHVPVIVQDRQLRPSRHLRKFTETVASDTRGAYKEERVADGITGIADCRSERLWREDVRVRTSRPVRAIGSERERAW